MVCVGLECACLFKRDDAGRAYLYNATNAVNDALLRLEDTWAAHAAADDTFAVVVQPFARGSRIPSVEFVSSVDCFHPGRKMQQGMVRMTLLPLRVSVCGISCHCILCVSWRRRLVCGTIC